LPVHLDSHIDILFPQECESSLLLNHVRVCLVEQFHGQECRIVLVSTVHPDSACCAENISVMLTRAQEGLYITGNLQMLANRSNIWHEIQKTLKKDDAVGTQLLLRCQVGQHVQNLVMLHFVIYETTYVMYGLAVPKFCIFQLLHISI